MGQGSSRIRRPQFSPPTQPHLQTQTTTPQDTAHTAVHADVQNSTTISNPATPLEAGPLPESALHEVDSQPTPRALKRSSVRRSLVNLVKPVATLGRNRTRVDTTASGISATAEKKRMSWRNSRRCSRAKMYDDGDPSNVIRSSSSTTVVAGSSSTADDPVSETSAAAVSSASPMPSMPTPIPEEPEQGKEREGVSGSEQSESAAVGRSMSTDTRGKLATPEAPSSVPTPTTEIGQTQLPAATPVPALAAAQVQPIPIPVLHSSTCAPEPEPSISPLPIIPDPHQEAILPTTAIDSPTHVSPTVAQGSAVAQHSHDHQSGPPLSLDRSAAPDQDSREEHQPPQLTVPPPLPGRPIVSLPPPPPPPASSQTSSQQQSQTPTQQQAHQANRQQQQFPPPGTLVVVQGIVHTTDVSRSHTNTNNTNTNTTSAGSNPNPIPNTTNTSHTHLGTEPTETSNNIAANETQTRIRPQQQSRSASDYSISRNRLSALLGRATSSRPASRMEELGEGNVDEVGGNGVGSVGGGSGESGESGSNAQEVTGSQGNSTQRRPATERTAISSSSIDVLGTLLSVAAAATAASLLTGSSEPILSSGLAPPSTDSTNSSSPSSPLPSFAPSPTSPTSFSAPSLTPTSSIPSSISPLSSTFSPRPTGIHDMSPAGRAERMRQAWSAIRERLGLRPTPPSSGSSSFLGAASSTSSTATSAPASPTSATSTERSPSLTDTREQMLAEMARAFNIGFGLGTSPGGGVEEEGHERGRFGEGLEADDEAAAEEGRERVLPPEGSFERFLVELQTDLRDTLTREPEPEEGDQRFPGAEQTLEADGRGRGGMEEGQTRTVSGAGVNAHEDTHSLRSLVPTEPADDIDDDLPSLQDPTYSDSSDDGRSNDSVVDDDFSSAATSPLPPPTDESTQIPPNSDFNVRQNPDGSGSRPGIDASGRINWWRLYRFPPVVSPRSGPVPEFTSTTPRPTSTTSPRAIPSPFSPSAPLNNHSSSRPSSSPSLSIPTSRSFSSGTSTTTSTAPSSTLEANDSTQNSSANNTPDGNAVIPVIIVGLQSVNTPNWRPAVPMDGMEGMEPNDLFNDTHHQTHHTHEHHHPTRSTTNTTGTADGEDADDEDDAIFSRLHPQNLGSASRTRQNNSQERRRGWQDRAASALRNLRPGSNATGTSRRSRATSGLGSEGQGQGQQQVPSIGGPGSRTFLIYVIGGYYPPDHSIVTGGPDNMESFEALLELVEMLGNAKPPTASKEDIEKSGLEVIKRTQLEEYERDSKISSNCTERCLICLDEYEEEDEIRVMACRHAFHKDCVDKWLQTGKNNCPACRSRGVGTTDGPTPQTVS